MAEASKELPVLYSFRRCPFAMRARLALRASGQTCVLREVVLRDKPDHMVALSEKATVPVLWFGGDDILDESLQIMHWALGQADPQGLMILSKDDRVLAERLIEMNDGPFKHHLDRYKYASRYEGADPLTHRDAAMEFLAQLEERLKLRVWLFGDAPYFADYAILPFVRQFRIPDPDWFDNDPGLTHVHHWLTRFLESEDFSSIMKKYKKWTPQAEELVFFPEISDV